MVLVRLSASDATGQGTRHVDRRGERTGTSLNHERRGIRGRKDLQHLSRSEPGRRGGRQAQEGPPLRHRRSRRDHLFRIGNPHRRIDGLALFDPLRRNRGRDLLRHPVRRIRHAAATKARLPGADLSRCLQHDDGARPLGAPTAGEGHRQPVFRRDRVSRAVRGSQRRRRRDEEGEVSPLHGMGPQHRGIALGRHRCYHR
mmetsp:Transcript_22456/g.47490  ORF Transcript_22456/g.47490 Transcript_22456/m.47490 type:complete len:200 (+) Transcript_22456:571-1170(+)